jgi:FecR protein
MKAQWRFGWLFLTLLWVAGSTGVVLAQDQDNAPPPQQYPTPAGNPPNQTTQDPSGRVARLEYTSGEVSMQPGGVNDWVAANLNRPLTTSDRVWTDQNSRAELNVGDGFIRMNSETSLTLTNISDSTVQFELDQGVLEVTVRHLAGGEIYEVDTPNFAFTIMKPGFYRFDVLPKEDQSWVTVRSGYGEATGKGAAVRVNSGLQVRFSGANSLQHASYSAPARDGFEDWAQVRDKRLENSVSARYVSPGVIGYQDLDAYGTWHVVAPYGAIWTPTSVPVGWAPYRYGSWVWIAPWGWTWVDSAPWGFAPFHYGRWVSWNGGWAWAPGPLGYWNPYYAPALVGWIGGPGFGVGFGFGGVGWGFGFGINFGWFPLGWGAPYYPHYCGWGYHGWYPGGGWVTSAYLRNVNVTNTHITNVTNITNNYYHSNFAGTDANRNIPGAVTAAPRSAFTSSAAINKVGIAVPKANQGSGQLMYNISATPTRQSVLGASAAARAVPPASATNRGVVTNAARPAGPARFDGNQSAMARTNSPAAQSNIRTAHAPGTTPSENQGNVAHTAPHPPSAGGGSNNEVARSNIPSNPSGHFVPRPPASNDSFARGNNSVNNRGTLNGSSQGTAATAPHTSQVPRPPANYTYHAPNGGPLQSAPSHQSAPSQHAAPRDNSHNSSNGPSRAYESAPRPSAGYTYHAAPAYSGSSSYAAGRMGTSSYAGSGRSNYSSSPSYPSNRSYGSSPTYMARNYGSQGSYSAPRSLGSSNGSYHSSGGGGYHASGGHFSGGHSGGGHSGGGHR